MQEQKKKLGKRIRLLRQRRGYTQKDFAIRAGINLGNFGKLERGQANVSLDMLIVVAKTLKVSWLELMDFDDIPDQKTLLREIAVKLENASQEQVRKVYRVLMDLLL